MLKVDLGPFTDEDMAALLKDVLDTMPESEVLPILRDWLKDNNLEGELDAPPS